MSFDLKRFGDKLYRYRSQFNGSLEETSQGTGIPIERLARYEAGDLMPTGDDVLILADFYLCDYNFFISNERTAPFDQTDTLFRIYGSELATADRWAIQEFLFLCECESFLLETLAKVPMKPFHFEKTGSHYKAHGRQAAIQMRERLQIPSTGTSINVYRELRAIGLHVFRRTLVNSKISGLFVRHPVAGGCVLVNYSEDTFRQQFTAVHEAGHAILDDGKDAIISFVNWKKNDLVEIRANSFASSYLLPTALLRTLPSPAAWTAKDLVAWSIRLSVNPDTLTYALKDARLIDEEAVGRFRGSRVRKELKIDPELAPDLTPTSRKRREQLLRRGLSFYYVSLCFEALREGHISTSRASEMLLVDESELLMIAATFGVAV